LNGKKNEIEESNEEEDCLKGFTLIDVGCGGGLLTERLGDLGATVVGLDPGLENVTVAALHLARSGRSLSAKSNVSYVCTTLEEFARNNVGAVEVDGIVLSEVLEHVDNPETAIKAASQLVKVIITGVL
jgi:polyprenyldihydroxybenzoate methyltransferase/3-demethylubiquinol 3-O-methyltransferase